MVEAPGEICCTKTTCPTREMATDHISLVVNHVGSRGCCFFQSSVNSPENPQSSSEIS